MLAAKNGGFRVLKERDFALLWSGQSVSSLGDGIFTIALALEALRIDHSPRGSLSSWPRERFLQCAWLSAAVWWSTACREGS